MRTLQDATRYPSAKRQQGTQMIILLSLDLLHCPYPIALQGFKKDPGKQAQLGSTANNQFPVCFGDPIDR